ncbi:MAG: DNA-protecting protein DprA, partial [Oscillospiraceae bacterium]|nr:DNA-protecting protein DprA [Oscillospiraceae bacterium]
MAELRYWVWMNELGLNPVVVHRVIAHLGGPKEAFFAERDDFARVPNLSRKDLDMLSNKQLKHVYRIQDDMQAMGGRILTHQDAEYPQRLRDVVDSPLVLYVRGRLPVVDDEAVIGIVGTRGCTPYGMKAAAKIAGEITRHGGLVVTGLAAGIDGAAAEGALREGGPVIGVLGTGVERVYPPAHKALFDAVLENGALVSEYPPG